MIKVQKSNDTQVDLKTQSDLPTKIEIYILKYPCFRKQCFRFCVEFFFFNFNFLNNFYCLHVKFFDTFSVYLPNLWSTVLLQDPVLLSHLVPVPSETQNGLDFLNHYQFFSTAQGWFYFKLTNCLSVGISTKNKTKMLSFIFIK